MGFENLVGQTLGQYELRALLGAGGMGAVYRGYQAGLRREVAVKVLPSTLAMDTSYIARFNREAEVSASLEHAHIVPVYDYGTQNGVSYVVMRLLTGGSLADRLRAASDENRPLPSLREISAILHQLAGALDYAHSRGVIHRDLKPGNIMFDNQGDAFVVDFGIAKLMNATTNLTGTGVGVGTPSFMPPEQWRSEELTPAADQYALAVVVYQMMTNHLPFEADTPFQAMHKHLNEPPTPPRLYRPDLPEAVALVLNRAMSKDAADRFPTVTAFAQAFDSAISGIESKETGFFSAKLAPRPPTAVPRTPLTPRAPTAPVTAPAPATATATAPLQPPPSRRNPILIGTVVTLVIIAALAFAASQFLNGNARESSFNATLTALAIAAAPTSTPVPASETPAPSATETVVAVAPTAGATDIPTQAPTDTPPPTLSASELSATAAPFASQTAQIEAQQTQTQAVHVTTQALAASPTPSVTPAPSATPTATDAATLSATATALPTDTPPPSETPTTIPTAPVALPTDTPPPSETPTTIPTAPVALPTDTPPPPETSALQIVVPDGHPVLVGLSAGISGSNAPIGIDIRRAVELVLQRRPEVVMNGHTYPVTLDVRDDACNINRSREVAGEFVSDASIVAVIGPMCSPGCRVAIPVYDVAHYTIISPSCTASDLTTNGSTSFNRTVTSDTLQGRTAAAYIYHVLHIRRIGVIGLNNSYSQGLVDSLTTAYTALGGEIVADVTIEPGSNTLRQQMQTLAASQPDLIFFAGPIYLFQQIAVSLPANIARSLQVPFMLTDTLKTAQGTTYSPNARLYVVAPIPPGGDALDLLVSDYASTYGEEPSGPYHAEAFDAMHLIIDAIEGTATVDENGNLVIDRAMLADYIRHVQDTYGANGLYAANGSGELSTVPVGVFQTVDGVLTHVASGTLDPASGKFGLQQIEP